MKKVSRLKKGVSIVEVVIAIAVIAIISVASVTMLTYSIKSQQKSKRDLEVSIVCENVIDCFRFNSDLALLKEIYEDYYDENTKVISRSDFSVQIEAIGNEITITAFDLESNEIYKLSYIK